MGVPITKTVTLVWDGVDWRDQETGVLIEGVRRIGDPSNAVSFYNATVPIDKSMDPDVRAAYEQVQKMIADVLYQRAAKTHMYFEQGPDQIVTVAYHREDIGNLVFEINQLTRRLAKLEKPWWKRW